MWTAASNPERLIQGELTGVADMLLSSVQYRGGDAP